MRLYSGLSTDFIRDNVHNRIAEKLKDAFFRQYRHNPAPSEVSSWRNSLRAVSQVIDDAKLHDHGVLLEYQLPMSSKRLDCMITGQDKGQRDNAVILELKQWERCGNAGADNLVTTFVGGRERDLLHPSAQVHQYQRYLEDCHTAFYDPPSPIELASSPAASSPTDSARSSTSRRSSRPTASRRCRPSCSSVYAKAAASPSCAAWPLHC